MEGYHGWLEVCIWHFSDMPGQPDDVRRGKADIRRKAVTSVFDPKRKSA